ncbi:hypothetical protein SEVIR_3G325300v4 [Setaria viridis]|uniref:Glucan endo-1,3-beta-D-glucosidase n=1 Tax=Setaria viridis TaxID=4556 RepID=A0A4U6VFZ1_SETVI|nr:glucan endo-1,3-beta-glucosidase GII-like [Setaria viridis]TKW28470.1 hypothetical protein SEVIR_3G325300v2 [Setaria viridis]
MAGQGVASVLAATALLIGVLASIPTAVHSIGVCYGTHGDGLPSAADVVQLYRSNGINRMRIYSPDATILKALRGSGIDVIVDETDLNALLSDASVWVQANVLPYKDDVKFKYIAVGNEVEGSDTQKILPAMQKLNAALSAAGLSNIKVSTAVKMSVLDTPSSPPSNGVFADPSIMGPIVQFLASTGSPLLANIYPYFAYKGADGNIDLNYALFKPSPPTSNGPEYTNLFDAMTDAMYTAMEKVGGSNVPIVVSESGWPSDGGFGASVQNAQTYNQNLIHHVGKGTPKRPGALETYIFAMFNENKKTGDETEKHFGLFNGQNKSPVYTITFQ